MATASSASVQVRCRNRWALALAARLIGLVRHEYRIDGDTWRRISWTVRISIEPPGADVDD